MRRRQAGFTLTEMMVVVTIIGILVTMAIVYLRGRVRPIDVANRVGDLVREASRRAVALGPVRADVAIAMGKARTQISAFATPRTLPGSSPEIKFTTVTFTLWRLQEDPPADPASDPCQQQYPCWVFVEQYTTDASVDVQSWAPAVVDYTSDDQRTTEWTRWVFDRDHPAQIPPLRCRPDGTCDPCTLFFQSVLPGPSCETPSGSGPLHERCGKLAVMPLGGAINTRADWN